MNLAQDKGKKIPRVLKSGILLQAVAHLHPVDLRVVPSEGHNVGDALVLSCQGGWAAHKTTNH